MTTIMLHTFSRGLGFQINVIYPFLHKLFAHVSSSKYTKLLKYYYIQLTLNVHLPVKNLPRLAKKEAILPVAVTRNVYLSKMNNILFYSLAYVFIITQQLLLCIIM